METIGQYLKQQRELRQVTLEQISKITRINLNWLTNIENDELDKIPAGVFAKGFVKSYAKSIGLDPIEVGIRYDEYRYHKNDEVKAAAAASAKGPKNFISQILSKIKNKS